VQEGNGRGQPASGDRLQKYTTVAAFLDLIKEGNNRPDEGCRQFEFTRVSGYKFLRLRHLVIRQGDLPVRSPIQAAHHPYSGTNDRDNQQAQPYLAGRCCRKWVASHTGRTWAERMKMPRQDHANGI